FTPALESEQIAQGRALLQILAASGLTLIAEDLGLVPDFLRTSLADLGVPGCKVLRWERQWDVPGAPYIAPEDYEERSAAMTGTHDTVPVSVWWTTTTEEERIAFLAILGDG